MKTIENTPTTIGFLLITGAVAVLVPYTILTITFDYPGILRLDTSEILLRFNNGGRPLIWTWFAFAITGVPLIPAYIFIGQKLEARVPLIRVATTIGIIGLIVQMIGLLRWTFVVPVLADTFIHATDEATKVASLISFKTIHQFAGVLLGEHIGQLFTIVWTVLMSISFSRLGLFSKWVNVLGVTSSLIYLIAQAELFATVMPGFPVLDIAGFAGSTLWLAWLVIIGLGFLKMKNMDVKQSLS